MGWIGRQSKKLRDRAERAVNSTNKTSQHVCSGAVPCSSTNPSHPWTQQSPQTGTLGCSAQALEDELAKNKSLSSKQLLPISLAGENSLRLHSSGNVQETSFPWPQLAHGSQPGCGARSPPPPAPALMALPMVFPQLSQSLACRSPGMTRFVILSHPWCCCSAAGPAASITNVPVSSLHAT